MIHVIMIGAICEDQDICRYDDDDRDSEDRANHLLTVQMMMTIVLQSFINLFCSLHDGDSEDSATHLMAVQMVMTMIVLDLLSIYSVLFINCILSNQVCSSTKRRARKTRSGRTVPSCWSTDASTR